MASDRAGLRPWIALLILVVLAAAVMGLCDITPRQRGYLQLAVFLPLVLLVRRVALLGVVVPRSVVACAVVGALAGAVVQYSHVDLAPGAFVVTRLVEDSGDQDVKIFRDAVRRQLVRQGALRERLSVAAFHQPRQGDGSGWTLLGSRSEVLTAPTQAQQLLVQYPHLGGVVWGARRWVRIALRGHPARLLGDLPPQSVAQRVRAVAGWGSSAAVVTAVSEVGLSHGPDPMTQRFIATLVLVWRDLAERLRHPEQVDPVFEARLAVLAGLRGRWSSHAHRAVPLFLSGTVQLLRVLSAARVEQGELQCALAAFRAAQQQLRRGDNPELLRALNHNYALALVVRQVSAGLSPYERKVLRRLRKRGALAGYCQGAAEAQQGVGLWCGRLPRVRSAAPMQRPRGRRSQGRSAGVLP